VTLGGAAWLYTYRVTTLIVVTDHFGSVSRVASARRIVEQPWWSVPATVAWVLAGLVIARWLLPPKRISVSQRSANHSAKSS
jgi:hypothetical protein